MRTTRILSCRSYLSIAALLVACSSDEDSSPAGETGGQGQTVASNQPSGGSGGGDSMQSTAGGDMSGPGESGAGESSEAPASDTELDDGDSQGGESPSGSSSDAPSPEEDASVDPPEEDTSTSFFVTSRGAGNGGDFGGIAGADAFCAQLASEVSEALGQKTWRAYLSTSTEDARDRIGVGPWRNAAGVVIANTVEQLHDQGPGGQGGTADQTWLLGDDAIALDEQGNAIPNNPVTHDILTGSNLDGTLSASGTCSDWTSQQGTTRNGHSNRAGGGQNPPSWNSAHDTGCAEPDPGENFQAGTVSQGGGRGSIYCFAID